MRTTLDLDDDLLLAAKELARQQNLSAGKIVSQLLRRALAGQAESALPIRKKAARAASTVTGFRPFPAGHVVTNETVNRLRDTEGI